MQNGTTIVNGTHGERNNSLTQVERVYLTGVVKEKYKYMNSRAETAVNGSARNINGVRGMSSGVYATYQPPPPSSTSRIKSAYPTVRLKTF